MPTRDIQLRGIDLELSIRDQIPRPQFPHGNYVGMMDDLAADMGLNRTPLGGDDILPNIVTPFSYHSELNPEIHPMRRSMTNFFVDCQKGYLRSRVAFLNMIGCWNFTREIHNYLDSGQSGYVIGSASFLPAHDLSLSNSLLDGVRYSEEGTYTLPNRNNLTISVQREDFYTYQANTDSIEIYFIKNSVKDNHFLSLKFPPIEWSENLTADQWWTAESDHWCSPDSYSAVYKFIFNRIHLQEIIIEMRCKGPFKDYMTFTRYSRPNPISC